MELFSTLTKGVPPQLEEAKHSVFDPRQGGPKERIEPTAWRLPRPIPAQFPAHMCGGEGKVRAFESIERQTV